MCRILEEERRISLFFAICERTICCTGVLILWDCLYIIFVFSIFVSKFSVSLLSVGQRPKCVISGVLFCAWLPVFLLFVYITYFRNLSKALIFSQLILGDKCAI